MVRLLFRGGLFDGGQVDCRRRDLPTEVYVATDASTWFIWVYRRARILGRRKAVYKICGWVKLDDTLPGQTIVFLGAGPRQPGVDTG